MNIIDVKYTWNGQLVKRNSTKYIILHHRAGYGNAESIHVQHLNEKCVGIGYHFYVRRDGNIYRGRPIEMIGAHTENYNISSVSVCFEGNFETDTMTPTQVEAGRELVTYLKNLYPESEVKRHKDFNTTACPGKNFPFENIAKGESFMTVDKAVEIIRSKAGLEEQTINFLLCYKYGEDLVKKLAEAMG